MDADTMARIYAQVVNGKSKEQSGLLVDDEASAFWDTVATEVDAMKAANPQVVFDIPSEVPSADDLTGMVPGGEFASPAPPEEGADAPEAPAPKPPAAKPEDDPDPDADSDDDTSAATDADADAEASADDEDKPGKPKKGVNPFADKEK